MASDDYSDAVPFDPKSDYIYRRYSDTFKGDGDLDEANLDHPKAKNIFVQIRDACRQGEWIDSIWFVVAVFFCIAYHGFVFSSKLSLRNLMSRRSKTSR